MPPPAVVQVECEKPPSCSVTASPSAAVATTQITAPTALLEIVRRHGTPTYAYDVDRIRAQAAKLRADLPPDVEILYSLKANASLGLCGVIAGTGVGADVASAGELLIALAAGFPPSRIVLTGPDKSAGVLTELADHPEILVSLDSVSELRQLAEKDLPHRVILRLRPDFCSYATCSAGPDSRFGLTLDDLPAARPYLSSSRLKVIGFHVFSGSQVLAAEGITSHLRGALDLSLRAGNMLGIRPEIIDIGGGFGIPYGPDENELEIAAIGTELRSLVAQAAPARLVMELGRYLVAQAGWYLTTVIAEQTRHGRKAVVVDGGSHHRTDMCGVGLRRKAVPVPLLSCSPAPLLAELVPTDILGCLSLPSDVLVEAAPLPPLAVGDVLAFPTAGAYGLYSAPCLFHGHSLPAEVAFDGDRLALLRARQSIRSVLDGQSLCHFQ